MTDLARAEAAQPRERRVARPLRAYLPAVILGILTATTGAALSSVWPPIWALLLAGVIVTGGGILAVIDLRTRTLPNRRVVDLLIVVAVVLAAELTARPVTVGHAALAAVAVFLVYAAMVLVGWCGAGDAKFAAVLALAAGGCVGLWAIALPGLAFILAALEGLARLAVRGPGRIRGRHPHGPALAGAGLLLAIVGVIGA